MDTTNEFSFILRPSKHGVGVFAAHAIKSGVMLRVFGDDNPVRRLKSDEVPEVFKNLCAKRGDILICPPDFSYMPIGWYLNHSNTPNAVHDKNEIGSYGRWLSVRDIAAGEEVTINYNDLDEPEDQKESFYRS